MNSDKIDNELEHLYEYLNHCSGYKHLAVKLAIKLIENEYVHENYDIINDESLSELLNESRMYYKSLKSLEKQTFFTSSHFKPHSVMDYFSISDDSVMKKEVKPVVKSEIIDIGVEEMPSTASTASIITHTGGSGAGTGGVFSIFCDGACKNNGKKNAKAGYGISVQYDKKEIYIVSKPLEDYESQTNQRAELHALSDALDISYKKVNTFASKLGVSVKKVLIYSDSEYSINCLTKWSPSWSKKGWRKANGDDVLHVDIIKPMFEKWTEWNKIAHKLMYDIQIEHVRSHTGKKDYISLGNERADILAVASIS
jgi:ribonuclease HI